MNIHLIAIGGSIMHNLAIALKNNGHMITGSDDVIYGISKDKLKKHGLLPKPGWQPAKIHKNLDLVILGMHAQIDNPELVKAQNLGLKIQSFPAFYSEQIKTKKKIVIAGSHGKTSTTSMIMHVLHSYGIPMDYLVGGQLDGFDSMVRISEAPIVVIEGDEYLSSKLDPIPKFHYYDPDITIITGVEWDHMNVFPTKENYNLQFVNYVKYIRKDSKIFFDGEDAVLANIIDTFAQCNNEAYKAFESKGKQLVFRGKEYDLEIFGYHNRKNLMAAFLVCNELGVGEEAFFESITTFKGAKQRLEKIKLENKNTVYRDFAHAPSKVRATVKAVIEKYPNSSIGVLSELHTYSSLNKSFLPEYKNTLDGVDYKMVCFDPSAVRIKKLEALERNDILDAFQDKNLLVGINKDEVMEFLYELKHKSVDVILILGSGNLFGIDIKQVFS